MTKHVYSTRELPHVWAHDSVKIGNGRNSSGSVSFNSDGYYSYAALIARFIEPGGDRIVLLSSDSWSTTTSAHQSAVASAVSHMTSFTVPSLGALNSGLPDHQKNWKYLREQLNERRNELHAARKPAAHQVTWCDNAAKTCNEYRALFNVGHADMVAFTDAERSEWAQKIDIGKIKAEAESERAQEKSALARAKSHDAQARLDIQRARQTVISKLTFGLVPLPVEPHARRTWGEPEPTSEADKRAKIRAWKRGDGRFPGGVREVYLRLRGDIVETSQGVSFPVSDAIALWPTIESVTQSGKELNFGHGGAEGLRPSMGRYPVNRIHANGDIDAGCHHVKFDEIRRLAIALKLIEPSATEIFSHKLGKLRTLFARA